MLNYVESSRTHGIPAVLHRCVFRMETVYKVKPGEERSCIIHVIASTSGSKLICSRSTRLTIWSRNIKQICNKGSRQVRGAEASMLHHPATALHEKSLQQSEAQRNGIRARLKGMNTSGAERTGRKIHLGVTLCVVIQMYNTVNNTDVQQVLSGFLLLYFNQAKTLHRHVCRNELTHSKGREANRPFTLETQKWPRDTEQKTNKG